MMHVRAPSHRHDTVELRGAITDVTNTSCVRSTKSAVQKARPKGVNRKVRESIKVRGDLTDMCGIPEFESGDVRAHTSCGLYQNPSFKKY